MKTLTVYKASAGSGKTFTLAVEYISLLIENPEAFRGILAVTFTNKATEEMKMRILSQLYGIAHSLPESKNYVCAIKERLGDGYSDKLIAERAEKALYLLLHNYHYFRVQTIDAFFQSVMRNLARELQLNANLRVGLNTKQVVEQAIDEMVDSIADDAKLRGVVMSYVRERMAGGESWNFIGNIKEFGENIFKDFYKEHRNRLAELASDPGFFNNYKRELNAIIERLDRQYRETGAEAMRIVEEHGLTTSDFSNYSRGGAISYFTKMAEGFFYDINIEASRMVAAMDDLESWVTKKAPNREETLSLVVNTLHPLMLRTEKLRRIDVRQYLSAKKTLEHINNVWLLRYVEQFAKRLNETEQRFMLSDTPTLLSEMVKDEDSPFIFEKIGAHLEHVMIDEFQDTSVVQWRNFKTLLKECMSGGGKNLVVGDVKQSIYRWRSGDWRLLNSIDEQFSAAEVEFKPLSKNYRSDVNVIRFNNAFLRVAAETEVTMIAEHSPVVAQQLRKAYADVEQSFPSEKTPKETSLPKGFVHVELMAKQSERTMEERTLDIIETLMENHERRADIAILVRRAKDAVTLATYLKAAGISVVSAEAFRLDASQDVCAIIDTMKEKRPELVSLSLHDMAEEIVRTLGLAKDEGAYVSTFFDRLREFTHDTSTVLEDFLQAWDDDICASTIETPDADGVRIMTIHKSKGLEFKHVILPYCDWQLEQSQVIWCQPKESPFNKLPIVPLNYTSVNAFKDTIYDSDIREEHVQNMVDNLNLLYVAMTRACSSLFVIGVRGENESRRSCTIEKVIRELPDEIEGIEVHKTIPESKEEDIEVSYGTLSILQSSSLWSVEDGAAINVKSPSLNPFTPVIQPLTVPVVSLENQAKFRQSNKSRDFAKDAIDETDRQRYIRMGTVMHQLFSEIRTMDDVLPTLQRMEFDGMLYDENVTKESLIVELRKRFQDPQVREWFSDRWTLYNECTILTRKGEQRPDRVMTDGKRTIVVDFKFGRPDAEHHKQVKHYMDLLREMNMPEVKGYLWYVSLNKIEEVEE